MNADVAFGSGYSCPLCEMDESGLTFYWEGDTLRSWLDDRLTKIIDLARSQAHDDAMMNDEGAPPTPDAQTEAPPPERVPIKLSAFQRTAIINSTLFNEYVDLMAKKAMQLLTGDNDELENALNDISMEFVVELGLADPTDDEAFEQAMNICGDVENEVQRIALRRVGPMILRQLTEYNRGD